MQTLSLIATTLAALLPNAATLPATKPAAAPISKPAVAKTDLSVISQQNPFDAKRKAWIVPLPPPPPPPALTEADVKIHGVIVVDGIKKALIELTGKLAPAPVAPAPLLGGVNAGSATSNNSTGKPPRPYRTVSIGDELGGYRITDITPQALVFELAGQQSTLAFNLAKGRTAAGANVPPPAQMSIVLAGPTPTVVNDAGVAETIAAAPPPMAAAEANNVAAPPTPDAQLAQPNAPDNTGAPTVPGTNGGGMSLLEAIQRAKQQAQQQPANTSPVTNPFLPQQPKP